MAAAGLAAPSLSLLPARASPPPWKKGRLQGRLCLRAQRSGDESAGALSTGGHVSSPSDGGKATAPNDGGLLLASSHPAGVSPAGWLPGAFRVAVVATAAAASLSLSLSAPDLSLAYIGGGPYGREVTRGQDLSGRDFSGLDLTGQDFKTSILRQANFKGAILVGASFFDSDLTGADFSDSDLRGADFSLASAPKANFSNANLEGATVTGNTSFKAANITGADFTDVLFREDQKRELCRVASGTNPVTGNDTRDTLFC